MSQCPKTLYDTSLNVFCDFLYNWSIPPPIGKNHQEENPHTFNLRSLDSNQPSINFIFSSFHARTPQWMLSSRPSSTDNLTVYNNFDDKISPLKKSCHNLMSTFFGRKSLESLQLLETKKKLSPPSNLYYRISENVCQDIIHHFQVNYKINDRTLSFPLFDGDVNTITNLQIEDATQITVEGMKVLKKHNLVRIKVAHLTNCTITELINNLSPWSIWNLESFSVPHCSLTRFNKICIILSLTRLINLIHLDVSHTSFNNQCLEIITDHLVNLKSIDLTATKITILKPLTKLPNLTRLNLHNVALTCKDEYIIGDLVNLEFLDISDERFALEPERYIVSDHLESYFHKLFNFERLIELDISGRRPLPTTIVCDLIKHRVQEFKKNPNFKLLRFLGLMSPAFQLSQIFDLDLRTQKKLKITGLGKLNHVINALIRYKNRPSLVQKALISLCQYTYSDNSVEDAPPDPSFDERDLFNFYYDDDNYDYDEQMDSGEILAAESRLQPNEIQPYRTALVRLIVEIMETHIKNLPIILFSSGNLYNLTKNNSHLQPSVLKKVVNVCIETMKHHSTDYQIIKNILLTLCSDRILQDITFDRFTCIRLVMDTLFTFRDLSVNRLALGISAILAAKIPTGENILLGSHSVYLKRLLDLVEESFPVNSQNSEIILKLSLSALWNFTDEAPKTCETFIKHNGIVLYVNTLVLFEGKSNIETKILGLLNNIAEVTYLRPHLVNPKLLNQLRKLIDSDQIDVSYFAIGILAQLASDPKLDWSEVEPEFNLDVVHEQMSAQIQSWPNPSFEMVAYRSFVPFMSLLKDVRYSSISLWALWAIHHVCTKNPNKYCRMLYDENCIKKIIRIIMDHLINRYCIYDAKQRQSICKRLIDLVTVADDEFQVLSKALTDWNCHRIHNWDILVVEKNNNNHQIEKECLNQSDNMMIDFGTVITEYYCDCSLKYHLDHDSFLRLPSIILKSFHCFSPIPLNLSAADD